MSKPPSPDDAPLNGQYRILRPMGCGGFSFIYQAQDIVPDDEVAIKELLPTLLGTETTVWRFLADAEATIRLTHEHIIHIHNAFKNTTQVERRSS